MKITTPNIAAMMKIARTWSDAVMEPPLGGNPIAHANPQQQKHDENANGPIDELADHLMYPFSSGATRPP